MSKKTNPNKRLKKSINFSMSIAVITFVLAAIFSVISSSLINGVVWGVGILIILLIILVGIFFDILGIASTAATEQPFHAMASEKIFGAKEAVYIIRNADRFASFCNDVVGDIAGIISGTATAVVVIQLAQNIGYGEGTAIQITINVIVTSVVAALTVGGKAIGKYFALYISTDIILFAGKVLAFFNKLFKFKKFNDN